MLNSRHCINSLISLSDNIYPVHIQGEEQRQCDILLPFLVWMDSDDLRPAVRAMEPELEVEPRRKTLERRLVWRRIELLLGNLMDASSVDLMEDELPVDEADLIEKRRVLNQDLS